MKIVVTAGQCANCENTDIDYGSSEINNGHIAYDYKCMACGDTGIEWYELNYIETISDKE